MGCCASLKDDSVVLLSNEASDNVTCKSGESSKHIQIKITDHNHYSVSGQGTMIGSCSLEADTAMWEVVVGKNPENVLIGVKRIPSKKNINLDNTLDEVTDSTASPSWSLTNNDLKEGDVVGVYWDQTDLPMLTFTVNGKSVPYAVTRIRPTVDIYPAVSVKHGSTCEVIFDGSKFIYPPKSNKFKMIICSTNLI